MRPKIVQEQTLQLKMNQSLIQAIHLLQFSGVEMIEYIREVSKENPLIEEVSFDYEINSFKQANPTSPIGEINQPELTMYEQLKSQLYAINVPDDLRSSVLFGIDSLNEDGYLDIDMDSWAKQCNITADRVEEALRWIQMLEPKGIGARSLQECIQLQLPDSGSLLAELLADHLDWVAGENIAEISNHFHLSEEAVANILKQIQSCHPKPGQLLAANETEYIIPEAYIYEENGNWNISFYKWHAPTIEMNESYRNLQVEEKQAANFLKEKFNQVNWLQQAIQFRSNTLEKVIEKIVEKQRMYFEHGAFMLQPLTLKEIAAELDVHISTVSRAITNKYVQTRHGVIPLKFFLQSAVKQRNGQQTASFVIKQLVAELINGENKEKPLSDQAIKNKLRQEFGITAARRTVMKYREQLGFPASTKRK
ncbi:RNA polymerase, sigma 54 subunit, RpoN/SigL [Lentibacillus halodurans]|uniref:RNA polymerase, sigma 54 subunit, RpoN/SigL n=1 Tax=Lentibacillus halodurans TaxID=237679 RepID=A0A1I0WL47_9BACI|nr:RNA polymerase factor sigma-54 [Lentibacillus halodurans]SFA89515.1 RNA polymerase, sigma 54 subunit, RpoN/SigL [Lentibacillus halodurans]